MKLSSLALLCLLLLLFFHTHFSSAKRGGGGFGKGFSFKKPILSSKRGSASSKTGNKKSQGTGSDSGHPKQPSNPQQPGSPYAGGYGGYGAGGYGGYNSQGSYAGYPGGFINQNPKNKVLSPHYRGSFGRGGFRPRGGSPFSRTVQDMNVMPDERSKKHGRKALMAAAGGAMIGAAVGYGLGRFPRPPFQFHSSREEYYYNHYMHRTYGAKSTDANDYSRDYWYSRPPFVYDHFMKSCMRNPDAFSVPNSKLTVQPASAVVTSAPDTGVGRKATGTDTAVSRNSSTAATSAPHSQNQPKANPVPPSGENNDDTVSIEEIGYPALVEQVKVRKCLEKYMVYADQYLKRAAGGAQGLGMGMQGFFTVIASALVMLVVPTY